jgi:hypothetical protein
MKMNFRRVGSIVGAGVVLLTAFGCSADAPSEEQEAELGRTTQALDDYWFCINLCESDYNDDYYACQIGPGDFWCLSYAQINLDMCIAFCPSWEDPPPTYPPSPPPPPPTQPPQRGYPPTCVDGGPLAPAADPVSGCDYTHLNWCYGWCDVCAWDDEMDACYDRVCEREYCLNPPCRIRMSGTCSSQCDWSEIWEACYEECLDTNCGPD